MSRSDFAFCPHINLRLEVDSAAAMDESGARPSLVSIFARWVFGILSNSPPEPRQDGNDGDTNHAVTPRSPWSMHPVDAATSPQGSPRFYASFLDKFLVYEFAENDEHVSVVPESFEAQDPTFGEIEWAWRRDDEETARDRLRGVLRLYDHLCRVPWHDNIARFVRRHEAGYLLAKASRGPLTFTTPPAREDAAYLALYQRWALQLLSALKHLHRQGITLNSLEDESLWLDDDFSISVASLLNAGHTELQVSAGFTITSQKLISPWSPLQLYSTVQEDVTYPGLPKGDLFEWASTVYRWMSGEIDILGVHDMPMSKRDHVERRVAEGQFDDWPKLGEDQLGTILIRAWTGHYESAEQVMYDVKSTLLANGRHLHGDDVAGIDWRNTFTIDRTQADQCLMLKRGEF